MPGEWSECTSPLDTGNTEIHHARMLEVAAHGVAVEVPAPEVVQVEKVFVAVVEASFDKICKYVALLKGFYLVYNALMVMFLYSMSIIDLWF